MISNTQKMEKVLVTGANGLLGANIIRQLLKDGYQVKAMLRKNYNPISIKGVDCELFIGEISNETDVFNAVSGCSYVIHSAANTSQISNNFEDFRKTNIEATKLLIKASKVHNINRFVFVSTANCFANGSIAQPGHENSIFMPWLKESHYAYSKFLAQTEVLREVSENSFPAIIVNPTFMLGAYDSKPSSGKLLLYATKNRILFYPPGGKSFVDVEYVVKSISNSLDNGIIGECYLLAGGNMSYKQFFKRVGQITGKRKILIPIPKAFLLALGRIGNILQSYFSLSLSLNLVNTKLLSLDNYYSNRKAIQSLAFMDTEIDKPIQSALLWFSKNNI